MSLIITILPSLVILFYFVFSDKFKEPKRIVIEVFLLGIASTIPAGYLNTIIIKIFSKNNLVNDSLLTGFFAGGLVEEILKFLILYFFVLRKHEFNEPMDGIVYGVTVSLGFATYENISYVFYHADSYGVSSLEMALARAFTAVPMHGLNGCVMGFYFGLYTFLGRRKYLGYAFVIPYFFHGTYNFLVGLSIWYILVLIILFVFAYNLHKKLKYLQKNKIKEHEEKKI
jgi:RsiW-degrading membrane proteinase PrsW (M82 family)